MEEKRSAKLVNRDCRSASVTIWQGTFGWAGIEAYSALEALLKAQPNATATSDGSDKSEMTDRSLSMFSPSG
jgi:hypothetical protein